MKEIVEINIGWLIVIGIIIGLIIYILYLRGMLHIRKLNIAFLNDCIDDLENAGTNFREEKTKLSNALREKGIEVDQLEKKIKRLENAKD